MEAVVVVVILVVLIRAEVAVAHVLHHVNLTVETTAKVVAVLIVLVDVAQIVKMDVMQAVLLLVKQAVKTVVLITHLILKVHGSLVKMDKYFDTLQCPQCGAYLIPIVRIPGTKNYNNFFNNIHCCRTSLDLKNLDLSFFKKGEIYKYFNEKLAYLAELSFVNKEIFMEILSNLPEEDISKIKELVGSDIDLDKAYIYNNTLYFHK